MLCLAAAVVLSAALTPPQLLAASTNEVLLTAPPRSWTGRRGCRLALAVRGTVVDPTLHEPAPLRIPTIELLQMTRQRHRLRRAALEAAAGNAWARSNARAHRVARMNDDILVRATAPESSEPSLDWALGRARRLLTARRRGCVDVLCAIEDDDDVFEDMVEIFTSGIRGEAARRADPTEPLARLVRVDAAVVPEDVARREEGYDDVLFRRATRGDDRAMYDRCLDERETCVYWVDSDTVQLPRGAAFVAAGSSATRMPRAAGGVVDWESAASRRGERRRGRKYRVLNCVAFPGRRLRSNAPHPARSPRRRASREARAKGSSPSVSAALARRVPSQRCYACSWCSLLLLGQPYKRCAACYSS